MTALDYDKSSEYYHNFIQSLRSKYTKVSYDLRLKAFMKFTKMENFAGLIEGKDSRDIEKDVINFIIWLKEHGHSLASQKVYLAALIHFYSINDVILRRKKIAKFLSNDDWQGFSLPEQGDKPYSREQISKILSFAGQNN
jgi:hypothetical protein